MANSIVTATQICNVVHENGAVCGRPLAHPGRHGTADHQFFWENENQAVVPVAAATCPTKHMSGVACALAAGHDGYHRTQDYRLQWSG